MKQIFNNDLFHLDPLFQSKEVFRVPEGFCLKTALGSEKFLKLFSTSNTGFKLYPVDPYMDNNILLTKSDIEGGELKIPSINTSLYGTSFLYDVIVKVYDNEIDDGTLCTDYSKLNTSYGDCLTKALKLELLHLIGCLPPWFSDQNQTCNQELTNIKEAKKAKLANLTQELYFMQDLSLKMKCLPSCKKMVFVGIKYEC